MHIDGSEDQEFSHPVAEAIKLLKKWKDGCPSESRPRNKAIHHRLWAHANDCEQCDGKMVSLSRFEKLMAGPEKPVTERPYVNAILHAIDQCYGIRPRIQGFQSATGEIVPDAFYCKEQADHFYALFSEHVAGAREVMGWADSLPCSLETPEFIQEHHAALFRSYPKTARLECIDLYNKIGLRQRERLVALGFNRGWEVWHLTLYKDLEAIALGNREYHHVEPGVRKKCLEDLLLKVSEPRWKIKLIVSDGIPEESTPYFDGMDDITCIDDRLHFRRDRTRTISYSTNPARVMQYRQVLGMFVSHASCREMTSAQKLLEELIERVPETNK